MPREEVLVMPQEAASAPNDMDEQVDVVPNIAARVGIEYEDEASASNITTDHNRYGVDSCRTKRQMARR